MKRSLVLGSLMLLASSAGCGDGRAMHPDASSLFRCTANADCDDHIPCTLDNCDVSATCQHTGVDSMCTGAGERCVVGTGCSTTMRCTDSSMCDDGLGCTLDTCDVGNVCGHQPVNSMCSDPTPVCDTVRGCVAGMTMGCTSSASCDDSIACTVDSCGVDMMCHHAPVAAMCAPGERCDTTMGCLAYHGCSAPADCTPAGETWWNFCDGDPTCDADFGCQFSTPRACHDTDPCTVDTCDRSSGTNGACLFVCDTSQASCGCSSTAPTCAGQFQLTPAPTGRCIVRWDLSTIRIDNVDGAITVTPVRLSTAGTLDTGASTTTCPSFTATRVISGSCTETYTLDVTFIDDDNLSGTFTVDFTGSGCFGCGHFSYSFSGTRI